MYVRSKIMYDVVIGLEIHAELKTNTKIFCSCENVFGSKPNTNVCPVCTGMPGALPVINRQAIELCIKAGLVFGCKINKYAVMERKNYFYPDLPKAYQISQMVHPFCTQGGITLSDGKFKALNRIHLEEDAGKLIHMGKSQGTLIDYNRGGTPLIEIVTEPVFENAQEVDEFLKKIREKLVFCGIADCKMEEGGLRVDVNISLKPQGSKTLGTRTEMKNINSFKSVSSAINFEIERQKEVLNSGLSVKQETRKWDDDLQENYCMRSKEESMDYRYFPDPDILPIIITDDDIERIRKTIPILPEELRKFYIEKYKLSTNDANLLTSDKNISDYYNKCVNLYNNPKKIANWIIVDLFRLNKNKDKKLSELISEGDFIYLIKLVDEQKLTRTNALVCLEKTIETKKSSKTICEELNLISNVDEFAIMEILNKFKVENPKAVEDFKTDSKVMSYIVGYVMKHTQGKANGQLVSKLIKDMFN